MDIAYVSALSALAGSVIGGFTSGLTNWLNQHSQARAERLAHDFSRREEPLQEVHRRGVKGIWGGHR